MNDNRILAGFAMLTVMAVAALGWLWLRDDGYSRDPAVAELERIRDAEMPKLEQMDRDERREAREAFRKRMEGLTEEQRMAFFESSAPIFIKLFVREVDRFLELPAVEQRKELDRRIDQMQARGGPPTRNTDPKRVDEMRKKILGWTSPEDRNKFESYLSKLNNRMEERGIKPVGSFF